MVDIIKEKMPFYTENLLNWIKLEKWKHACSVGENSLQKIFFIIEKKFSTKDFEKSKLTNKLKKNGEYFLRSIFYFDIQSIKLSKD